MKIAIALLAIFGLVAAHHETTKETKYADKEFLAKQKFLFEIVYRVEDPLMFEEYIKLGKSFHFNKDEYNHHEIHLYMKDYYNAYKYGVTLPKGEFFGALVTSHYEQLHGLFEFFYYAKNWEIFQRNVCWARLHANEGLFVQALTLAVIHRDDFHGLTLPTIYEIFPQYFFNSKFIYQAEKFDYDTWSKYIMYEKEYKDILYTNYAKYFREFGRQKYDYYYTKDFKMWQWWKMMGLGEHWYSLDYSVVRDHAKKLHSDAKYLDTVKDVKMFWMPVDYTRDIDFYNQESELSYFTEDLEWNAFWYYFNLDYAPFLSTKDFGLAKERRGEYYVYVLRQILARYYMERLSHGYGEIAHLSAKYEVEHGYDSQLIHYNGVGYSHRENYFDFKSYGDSEYIDKARAFYQRIDDIIDTGFYTTAEGKTIDMSNPESIEYLGNMMQANVDTQDKYFSTFWFMFTHMYMADVKDETYVSPHVFLNYETMFRDPMAYMYLKRVAAAFFRFHNHIPAYTQNELLFPGVEIKNVEVSKLVTIFDLFDFDVTSLLNDKMTFVDGEFVWDKTLLARQMRLNHRDFNFEFSIESDKVQKVIIRSFLGPKYDEYGRILSLSENRENFMEIDEFIYELKSGINTLKRSSKDFYWTSDDRSTYTEMYKYIMLAYEGKYEYPLDYAEAHCGFPDRLILPRGWAEGMPMQFFFIVSPYTEAHDSYAHDHVFTCLSGSGHHSGAFQMGYPFDREIDEQNFFVPNMYFKDVKIFHYNLFERYYIEQHVGHGTFDYKHYLNFFSQE